MHPDRRPDNPNAKDIFNSLTKARNAALRNAEMRTQKKNSTN